jgi:signal peptidase II
VDAETATAPGRTRAGFRWALIGAVAAVVLALDQLTKWWAVEELANGRVVDVVWTLRFKLAYNTGSAFSLAQGRGALISVLALVVVAVLLRTGRHATRPLTALALGLVVGGALGNLADRAFRDGPGDQGFLGGAVVDFVDLQWWPVFNLADSAIVVGAVLLVMGSWREERDGGDAHEPGDAGDRRDAEQGRGDRRDGESRSGDAAEDPGVPHASSPSHAEGV